MNYFAASWAGPEATVCMWDECVCVCVCVCCAPVPWSECRAASRALSASPWATFLIIRGLVRADARELSLSIYVVSPCCPQRRSAAGESSHITADQRGQTLNRHGIAQQTVNQRHRCGWDPPLESWKPIFMSVKHGQSVRQQHTCIPSDCAKDASGTYE